MSLGAGLLLALASVSVASKALEVIGPGATIAGVLAGAATFSLANAALTAARHRKRCGECQPQPSEADAPGSGTAIVLGTVLDAVPEGLILGVSLRAGPPDMALIGALAISNLPEALSGTAGMRLASRSILYVLGLWSGVALGTAAITALGFHFLGDLGHHYTTILEAFGAGALIAMAAETMIPEAFHNGPRYSGLLAAVGFSMLTVLGELAR
ncbi:MAG: ZIP family zinc transporter [Polyangiaceae bacterium]|nr:ZIP family zinc transporter [Polyangiaceae bacterium]